MFLKRTANNSLSPGLPAKSDGKAACAYPRDPMRITFKTTHLGIWDMYGNTMEINDNGTNDLNGRVGKIRLIIDGYPRYFTLDP